MSDHYNVNRACGSLAWQTTLVYCDIKEPPSSMLWNVNIHICSETLWKSFRINLKLKFSDVRGSDCPLLSICNWKTLNWNHSLIGNRETKDRITFTNRLFFLGSHTIIFGCLEFLEHTIFSYIGIGLLARSPASLVQKKYCRQLSQENQSHHWSNQIRYNRNSLQVRRNRATIILKIWTTYQRDIKKHFDEILRENISSSCWGNSKSSFCMVVKTLQKKILGQFDTRTIWHRG